MRAQDMELLRGAHEADLGRMQLALSRGANVNCTTEDGWTPLLAAASYPKLVKFLLGQGADPNIASARGYTPLMRAAGLGILKAVQLLLGAGADPNARDCNSKTADILAAEQRQMECVAEIISQRKALAAFPKS
jgi:ankyrin repeat protein